MEPFKWSSLNNLQLGRYAEYLVKMEFTKHGMAVFSAEVDDIGIDFIVRVQQEDPERNTHQGKHYDIQVKSSRSENEGSSAFSYVYCLKSNLPMADNFFVALALFQDEKEPKLYLIPATAWREQNALLVYHDYAGKRSSPEYGLNLSKRNLLSLELYAFSQQVEKLRTQ